MKDKLFKELEQQYQQQEHVDEILKNDDTIQDFVDDSNH